MPDPTYELWCLFQGDTVLFPVTTSPTTSIGTLKKQIKVKGERTLFSGIDALSLNLWQADVDYPGIKNKVRKGEYMFETGEKEPLEAINMVSDVWPQPPSRNQIHIYITLRPGMSLTLVQRAGEPIAHVAFLQAYEDIFIKVKDWNKYKRSDMARNQIRGAEDMANIPNFVQAFEQKLVREPRLDPDMQAVLQKLDIPPGDLIAEDELLEEQEPRYAQRCEVVHTAFVSVYDWEKDWRAGRGDKRPLKGYLADLLLFYPLTHAANNGTVTVLRDKRCPITMVVKREAPGQGAHMNEEPRKYKPRPDFLISHSSLPRLLVEFNSTLVNSWPTDLVRMLTTGAFIVRFANRFLKAFEMKNFVLCAIFVWDNGNATRYSLFQQQNDDAVYYKEMSLSLNNTAGRIEFIRHLYNLLQLELDQDEDQNTQSAINDLNSRIESNLEDSVCTKDDTGSRKRTRTGNTTSSGNRAGEVGGDDHAQLRAQGYEVKPEVDVDASGGEWAPLCKMPDHILTVYRPIDSNKEFIAKKIREGSKELEVLRLLDTFPLKSDHVISLIDSFHGWAILPKMVTVKSYDEIAPNPSESKVSQICLGLIKGLTYLHEHHIAHRDIKPDNLLLNENFCLKIIDFDIAMRVEDEDEEVDDHCGTKNWMAPEVEMKLRHSPIKADRWACGRFLLFLLDKFGKEDKSLRAFATNLMAYNPKHRPSLLEWCNDSAPLLPDVGTVGNFDAKKASQPRRDAVEVDKASMKPPDAKKQRLDASRTRMILLKPGECCEP